MRVAIHQPNFLPWAGYFYKLLASDVFIFFDTVQFPRGKSYCSRVKIKTQGGERWLTVPVAGKGKLLPICDMQISGSAWVKKHLGTLKAGYGKAPYFNDYYPALKKIYSGAGKYIADFNIQLIRTLANFLGAKTEFVRASELDVDYGETGDYIISLVHAVGGKAYITGLGAGTGRYLEEAKLLRAGIKMETFQYVYPRYRQQWGNFVPGLSVVDVLFNTGPQARDLIMSGGMVE